MAAVTRDSGPRYGRAAEHSGPPTALFNKALAVLKYELDHLDELTPSPAVMDSIFSLVTTAADCFQDEGARGIRLQTDLRALLGQNAQWQVPIGNGSVKPNGVWFEGPFAYLIFE